VGLSEDQPGGNPGEKKLKIWQNLRFYNSVIKKMLPRWKSAQSGLPRGKS